MDGTCLVCSFTRLYSFAITFLINLSITFLLFTFALSLNHSTKMKIVKMLRRARKAVQRLFRLGRTGRGSGRTGSGRTGSGRTGSGRTELAACNLADSQDPAGASHPQVDVGQVASGEHSRDRDREDMESCWLREGPPVTPKYSGIRG